MENFAEYVAYRRGILMGISLCLLTWAVWQMLNAPARAYPVFVPMEPNTPHKSGEKTEEIVPERE